MMRKFFVQGLIWGLFFLLHFTTLSFMGFRFCTYCFAETNVGGSIRGNTVWSNVGGDGVMICGNNSVVEIQAIPTNGGADWESFSIGGETYLAVANCNNGSTCNIDSRIYKWSGSSFVEIRAIPTNGAGDLESFSISGETYLAVLNGYNESTHNIDSRIYKVTSDAAGRAGAPELCDNIDNDCNGEIDESLSRQCSNGCGVGQETCQNGQWVNCNAPQPQAETCDGLDNDCDDQTDEDLTQPCTNACGGKGTETCQNGKWVNCTAPLVPVETCDGLDNDCDGKVDEDLTQSCTSPCGTGTETCQNGKWVNCTAPQPQAAEICDGKDNDCDGQIDEGVKNTYYQDADADGYGNPFISIQACTAPAGYVGDNTDCDDTDKNIHVRCGQKECDEEDVSGSLDIGGSRGRVGQTGQVVPGQAVQIPVRMQSSPNEVSAFGFKVTYDPGILEYSGFEKGDLVKSFDIFGVNPVGAGKMKVGGVYSEGSIPKGSSGDLVWLKFTVKGGQKDACYPLRLESLEDHVVNFPISGGCFCIRPCDGDLNGDGAVTPSDALAAFKCYLESGPCLDCSDVNQDGSVTPIDALCVFKKFLGQASCMDMD